MAAGGGDLRRLARDRILRYVDVNDPRARRSDLERPDESSWHGLMTSVVAGGNGWLSRGLYRGLASEARLVLVKVGTARRIRHDDIRRGLEWVVRHRRRYRIRIVTGAYKHVDGTSFAAPIVAAIAAQMLEVNPALAPRELKQKAGAPGSAPETTREDDPLFGGVGIRETG